MSKKVYNTKIGQVDIQFDQDDVDLAILMLDEGKHSVKVARMFMDSGRRIEAARAILIEAEQQKKQR